MRRSAYATAFLAATALLGLALLWPKPPAPLVSRSLFPPPLAGDERPIPPVGPDEDVRLPSFDILRIEPTGTGAASGRAAPAARIMLRSDGTTVASAVADDRGEWALMIRQPLPAGDHVLSLLAELADGRGVASSERMIVSIPEQRVERPLVLLMAPDAMSEVMQSPDGLSAQAISIEAVDEDKAGALRIGGRAEPGTALNLYLDNIFIGAAVTGDEGRWSLKATKLVRGGGPHHIRADALAKDETGATRVAARLEVPFAVQLTAKGETAAAGFSVQGEAQSWRIRQSGQVSTLVYGAAAARALDPTVAYPGQVAEPPVMPTADR